MLNFNASGERFTRFQCVLLTDNRSFPPLVKFEVPGQLPHLPDLCDIVHVKRVVHGTDLSQLSLLLVYIAVVANNIVRPEYV